jgi:hypothetical protein
MTPKRRVPVPTSRRSVGEGPELRHRHHAKMLAQTKKAKLNRTPRLPITWKAKRFNREEAP